MKKIFLVLLFVIALFSGLRAQIGIRFEKDTTCRLDTVLVPMKVIDLQGATSFNFEFTFDPSILKYDSLFWQNPVYAPRPIVDTFIAPNRIRISWDSTLAILFGDGDLVVVQFTAINSGSSTLTYDVADSWVRNPAGANLPVSFTDGSVYVKPSGITYSLSQIMEGCRKENKGRYSISITSGIEPYQIDWNGGFLNPGVDTVVLGLTGGEHLLTIVDGNGCNYDTTYMVKVKKAPKIHFTNEPDSVFLQKPEIQFTSNIDSLISVGEDVYSWQWNFGEPDSSKSTEMSPKHFFNSALTAYASKKYDYPVKLWAINDDGCDTAVVKIVKLHKSEVKVPSVFTPNADGFNDILIIQIDGKTDLEQAKLSKFYQQTEFVVFNRNGKKVYESNDYQNNWNGDGISDGTYFYVLKCIGFYGTETFQGVITVLGSRQ